MRTRWINRTVWGIVLATFFSDVSHEMCTAVLPDFIRGVGLGALALGFIDGVADFMVSLWMVKRRAGYVREIGIPEYYRQTPRSH